MLLELMVDAANRGWRDSNGLLSKQIVESKILPVLNAKLSRLKWFKTRYHSFTQLMRHSSGFGWDSVSKKFTATEEVWQDYFKIGNGTAAGKNSIGLGDDTDARTYEVGERKKPKTEFEANNNSVETITRAELVEKVYVGMDSIAAITTEIRGMHSLMEKREKEREKTNNVWDAIKETPNLDNRARYKALGLVHKLGMKNAFLKMSPEERSEWILYTME
ncbi:hypothetical protein ACE6H2_016671 [Prunus campanulata]